MSDRPATDDADPPASGTLEIRVLHVDDDPDFSAIVEEFLHRTDSSIEVVTETSVDAALRRLALADIDCVVSDYQMPDRNGLDLLQAVRADNPELPFILFTGKGSEEIASEAISAGVTDYLQKRTGTDQFEILANRVVNAVSRFRAERDLATRAEQQTAIASLGQLALERRDLDRLFDAVVESVQTTLGVDHVAVLSLEADGTVLRLRAGAGWDSNRIGETTIDSSAGTPAGVALDASEPVVIEDLHAESRFAVPPLLEDAGVTSGVSVVIGPTDDPWGVLGVLTTERRSFTADEVTFVQSVANVLAEAVKRHEYETRLREGEERFRRMAEASPDVIFRTNRDGVFTYVSPVVESVLGYDRDLLEGDHFGLIVAESSLEAAATGFQRVLTGDAVKGLLVEIKRDDGEPVWMEINAVPLLAEGEIEEVLGFSRDISEELSRQRTLGGEADPYRLAFEVAPDPMVLTDEAGEVVDANPAACELLGRPHAELVGQAIGTIAPAIEPTLEIGGQEEVSVTASNGRQQPVEVRTTRDVVPGVHLSILRPQPTGLS